MSDAERFVERFARIWAAPDPDEFAELWDEKGTLLHPGMEQPIPQSEIPDYVRRIRTAAPDISLQVERWAASGDFVLIEWTITARLRGEPLRWSGTDRFTLRGDRAVEGIAYFDSMPLWAKIDPSLAPQMSLEDALAAAPQEAGA